MKIKIRKARKSDSPEILKLIIQLADFEKLDPPGLKAQYRLIKDAFGKKPLFNILIAECFSGKVRCTAGYAFYFYTYSTFLAKRTLYLEDIFVSTDFRSRGIGGLLFEEIIKTAKAAKCGRIEFTVLNWNKNALRFYKMYKAETLNEWLLHRIVL